MARQTTKATTATAVGQMHARLLRHPSRARAYNRRPMYAARFYAHLGKPPAVIDLALARHYWMQIVDLLDRGGWTRNERTVLRRLEKVWRMRMLGNDHRWLVAGTRPGRLDRELETAIRPPKVAGWGTLEELLDQARGGANS